MSVHKLEFLSFKSRMFPQINIRSMKCFTRDLKMVIFLKMNLGHVFFLDNSILSVVCKPYSLNFHVIRSIQFCVLFGCSPRQPTWIPASESDATPASCVHQLRLQWKWLCSQALLESSTLVQVWEWELSCRFSTEWQQPNQWVLSGHTAADVCGGKQCSRQKGSCRCQGPESHAAYIDRGVILDSLQPSAVALAGGARWL